MSGVLISVVCSCYNNNQNKHTMKAYSNKQIESALSNRGFICTGGENGLVEIKGMKGRYEEGVISTWWESASNTGGNIFATVEGGKINGEHPHVWFDSIKEDLAS